MLPAIIAAAVGYSVISSKTGTGAKRRRRRRKSALVSMRRIRGYRMWRLR